MYNSMTFSFQDFMNGVGMAQQASTAVLAIPLSAETQTLNTQFGAVRGATQTAAGSFGDVMNSVGSVLTNNPIFLIGGGLALIILLKA